MSAVACSAVLFTRSKNGTRRIKWSRVALACILLVFVADVVTGGNYRWLSIALDRDLKTAGGPERLQQWAEQLLSSPDVENQTREQLVDARTLPPDIHRLAAKGRQIFLVYFNQGGGPWMWIGNEGPEVGWGYIVGHRALTPADLGSVISHGWIQEVQPGVFFYAWGFNFKHS